MKMRLDRWLATVSAGSRSEVKQWIRGGQAAVNGRVILDPALSFETETDRLSLNGRELDGRVTRHVMLHKPAGILTAARDARQPTVMDLLPPVYRSIGCMPVGRLDKDTTGLLLLTTDGTLAHRLLAPARHVDKTYRAAVDGPLSAEDTAAFAAGLTLSDFTALPARLEILETGPARAVALVTVREGKFHQVRRMFAAVGREVTELHRLTFGPLSLDPALGPGEWRDLTGTETAALYAAAGYAKDNRHE